MQPQMIHRVGANGPWVDRSLRELGVPDFDIVKVESSLGPIYYQLAAAERDHQSSPRWE